MKKENLILGGIIIVLLMSNVCFYGQINNVNEEREIINEATKKLWDIKNEKWWSVGEHKMSYWDYSHSNCSYSDCEEMDCDEYRDCKESYEEYAKNVDDYNECNKNYYGLIDEMIEILE